MAFMKQNVQISWLGFVKDIISHKCFSLVINAEFSLSFRALKDKRMEKHYKF